MEILTERRSGVQTVICSKNTYREKGFFYEKTINKTNKKRCSREHLFYIFKNYSAVTTSDVPSTVADSVTSAKNSAGTYVKSLTISGAALSVSGIILPLT